MEDEISIARRNGAASPQSKIPSEDDLDLSNEAKLSNLKFAFTRAQLQRLISSRSIPLLQAYGGIQGLAAGLRTDLHSGLSTEEDILEGTINVKEAIERGKSCYSDTIPSTQHAGLDDRTGELARFSDRKAAYGDNRLPPRRAKSFLQLLWMAFNDKLMFLLTASAVVSLALGIYETISDTGGGVKVEWVEGVAIMIAIIIIISITAANDWQKNRKFEKLNAVKDEHFMTVVRSGKQQKISVFNILVGDIVHLEAGDVLSADGVLLEGFDVQCDESSSTGEADLVHKSSGTKTTPESSTHADPFILAGSKVANGIGTYLVTSTGVDTGYGKILSSLRSGDIEETPLQQKLAVLAKYIVTFGLTAGALFFAVTFIRYLAQLHTIEGGPEMKGEAFLDVLLLSIAVIVIAVPEGLPLTVTLALAFATTRMLKDKNLVRLLRACETMGNATTICSDKTGTLTLNKMSVVAGMLGPRRFEDVRNSNSASAATDGAKEQNTATLTEVVDNASGQVKDTLMHSIALNSTAFEHEEEGSIEYVGSSTETALLNFAREHLEMGPLQEIRTLEVVQLFPFNANSKCMSLIVKMPDGTFRMFVKGAAEVVLGKCTNIITEQGDDAMILDTEVADTIHKSISNYASRSLRPIGMAYRDFEEWPPIDAQETTLEVLFTDMAFISVFGIQDPLRPEVIESVQQCQSAGVFVRMVTGDNFHTAKAIAQECGIYNAGGIALDGPTFRKLSSKQLDLVLPRLQVLARSTPEDKMTLVSHLKGMGDTVAVTGDGTNDALALQAADVGFAMGISGTEVAKEASSIILMDDNFASILKALLWGRTVNDAAKKFVQFQFTINFSAGILTVVSVLVGGSSASVFTVVQLLWINLIMDTFAALALATDYPTKDLLERKPEPRTSPILNLRMWKMIIGQSMYQLAVLFTFHYAGVSILSYDTAREQRQLQTMIFNVYVWMQIFNQTNSRRIDNKLNILEGILSNPWFFGVQIVTMAGQTIIVFKGGQAFGIESLNGAQWGYSLVLGFLTIPIGMLIRLTPDSAVFAIYTAIKKCFPKWKLFSSSHNDAQERRKNKIKNILKKVSRRFRTRRQDSILPTSQDGSVRRRGTEKRVEGENDTEFDLSAALDVARYSTFDGLEIHPLTSKDDPIVMPQLLGGKVPPSQNPELLEYFSLSREMSV